MGADPGDFCFGKRLQTEPTCSCAGPALAYDYWLDALVNRIGDKRASCRRQAEGYSGPSAGIPLLDITAGQRSGERRRHAHGGREPAILGSSSRETGDVVGSRAGHLSEALVRIVPGDNGEPVSVANRERFPGESSGGGGPARWEARDSGGRCGKIKLIRVSNSWLLFCAALFALDVTAFHSEAKAGHRTAALRHLAQE